VWQIVVLKMAFDLFGGVNKCALFAPSALYKKIALVVFSHAVFLFNN